MQIIRGTIQSTGVSGDAWLDLATLGPALRTRVVPVRHAAPHLDEAAGQTLRLSSASWH